MKCQNKGREPSEPNIFRYLPIIFSNLKSSATENSDSPWVTRQQRKTNYLLPDWEDECRYLYMYMTPFPGVDVGCLPSQSHGHSLKSGTSQYFPLTNPILTVLSLDPSWWHLFHSKKIVLSRACASAKQEPPLFVPFYPPSTFELPSVRS